MTGDPEADPQTGSEKTLVLPGSGAAVRAGPGIAPERIGPYRLVERLGEGGMGEVWLAEQVSPVQRRVAVKLIKAGMDTWQVVARFESERQALALMDHPAIAKIFEAGSTPEGRPYFVMEYVAGAPITEFCDREQLSLEKRLALFIRVCEGVQHAHQKAILHRDLKPSNVLVLWTEEQPQPKIIDFGIAKAIGEHVLAATLHTELGRLLGTPEYMSPEQADTPRTDVDTRTDVYSMGVILYQLLTGSLPFPSQDLRAKSEEEIRRVIREVDPPRPSTRVPTLGADLDAIALKAMEKERDRRYGSVSELAADVGRYLRNEPVLAHAPSTTYRMRKYIRRHRVGVAVAAALLAVLVAFAATTAVQARRVARERDRANAEARRATREAAAAQRVSAFLTRMFKLSSPSEAKGNTVTAREVLDQAAISVDSELSSQPELQAQMKATIGHVYANLGLYPRAHPLLEAALQTRTRLLGDQAPETLESMGTMGSLLMAEGRNIEAESLIRKTLEVEERVLGPRARETLLSRGMLAAILDDRGDPQAAERMEREVLEGLQAVAGRSDSETLAAMNRLAGTIARQGRLPDAERLYRETLAAARAALGADAPDSLNALANVAAMVSNQGRPAEAEPLIREVIERESQVYGPEHASTLISRFNLAVTLKFERRLAESEAITREVLSIRRRVLGPDHPDTLAAESLLSNLAKDQGRFAEAQAVSRKLIDTRRRLLGPDHPETAKDKYNLACILAMAGQRAAAVDLLQDAVAHGLPDYIAAAMGEDSDLKSLRSDQRFQQLAVSVRPQGH